MRVGSLQMTTKYMTQLNRTYDKQTKLLEQSDGAKIRRCATENNITMFTALDTVRVLLDVLEETTLCISTIDA